jgi:pimeloyl-ACP methyl ester carboxylesterase
MTLAPTHKQHRLSSLAFLALGTAAALLTGKALDEWQQAKQAERRNPPRGRFISMSGVRLHYFDSGGSGTPVVLLHGNGTMAEDFRASGIFQELAKANRVIAFDRPGFGYSERPREKIWSPAAQARLLASALDGLGIGCCVVVGHSWGTLVALALASEHQHRVRGLVLISGYYFASFRWDAVASIGGALPVIGDLLHYTLSPTIGRRFCVERSRSSSRRTQSLPFS